MSYEVFENLEYIPKILAYLEDMKIRIEKLEKDLIPKLDLSKSGQVAKYLDISISTLNNMLNDGRFKEGVHFRKIFKNKRYRIIFIESAIVKYKKVKHEVL